MPDNIPPDPRDFVHAVEVCISLLRRLEELWPHLPDGSPKYSGMNSAGWDQVDKVKQQLCEAQREAASVGRALAMMVADRVPVLQLVERVEHANDFHTLVDALRAQQPLIEIACIAVRESRAAVPGGAASAGGTIETPKSDDRKDKTETAPTQPLAGNVFERSGDAWRIVYQGREKSYRDVIGFQYLALLLKDPGKPKTVRELFFGVPRPNRQRITAKQASELTVTNGEEGDPDNPATLSPGTGDASQDPVYDKDGFDKAKEKYQELLADCATARREGDQLAEREAEEQLKALMQTFKGDLNLAGKPRQMLRATEKQRKDIQKAINTALTRVERHDKVLATHLRKMVQTGGTCVYNGDAGWIVTL